MNRLAVIVAGSLLGGLLVCSNSLTGGIGHEGEARVAGRVTYESPDSVPAGAAVYLHEASFTADTLAGQSDRLPDAMVDDEGSFQLDSVPAGTYCIEINDGNSFAVSIRCTIPEEFSTVDLPPDTLRKTGTIRGRLMLGPENGTAVFVQVFGLDRIARLDANTDSFVIADVPEGKYDLRMITSSDDRAPTTINNIVVESGGVTKIGFVYQNLDSAEPRNLAVFLNTGETGAAVGETLYRFPVLIRLRDGNFDFTTARSDGSDIRFVKSNGEPLPFEIERWNANMHSAEVWVGVDTLFGNDSTQYITMLWGVAPEGYGSSGHAVFDTARGFQGVWHMGEAAGDTARDATVNAFYGVPYGMGGESFTGGLIGSGRHFDGVSSYLAMPTTTDSKLNFPENGCYTLSAWVLVDTLDDNYHAIVTKSNQLYGIAVTSANLWEFYEFEEEDSWKSNQAPAQSGSWKFVTGVSAGELQLLYVDGECVDSSAEAIGGKKYRVTTDPVTIGKRSSASVEGWFAGMIDEVRIESVVASPAWVKCCYMNQRVDDRLVKIVCP